MKLRNKKTGEIGKLHCDMNVSPAKYGVFEDTDIRGHYWEYGSLAELNEEWEDYEEPKGYWKIDTYDGIVCYVTDFDDNINIFDKSFGNYFETKEEAEQAVEKLKAWKRLKDKGFKLDAVVDSFFCLDIYMKGEPYEEIKEDLKIVFGDEE